MQKILCDLKKSKNKKAATLIEALLYIALFGIIFLVIIEFALNIGSSNDKTQVSNEMQRDLIFVNEHVTDSFSKASSIDSTNSVFNSPDGILRFNTTGGFIEYKINQGHLVFEENSDQENITRPNYEVTEFTLQPVQDAGLNIIGVNIAIQMDDSKSEKTREFHTTYFLD